MADNLIDKIMANIYVIIIGIVFIIGGASGKLALIGLGSLGWIGSLALILVGIAMLAYTAYNIFRTE